MQSGGERYGMGQADMQAYAGGGASGGAGGAGGARGLAHLFGHPQTSSDVTGLHTLHLHRPLLQEQQYIDLAQLRGSAPQQGAPSFLHPSQLATAAGSYQQMPSFFKTSQAGSLSGQQQVTADTTTSHSFFHHIGPGSHAASHHDQFKLSNNFNTNQLHQEEDASASHNLGRSTWLADETAALLKACSDMDPSSKAPSVWEDVSRKLQDIGYNRSPQKCKEKFESFHTSYKKGKEGSDRAENPRRELEFSSDFSSEGGHAGGHVHEGGHARHVQNSDNYDNDDDQEDDPELQDTENLKGSKKRKMGPWTPSKSFFEKLSREIMEKQEALHKAFLETIEKKDRERAMREEAYRRQEAARLDREQDIRAQEVSFAASRDAALIAFLEKVTGQSLSASLPKITGLQSLQGVPPLSSSTTPPHSASAAAASFAAALLQQPVDHHLLHHQSLQDAADMDNSSDLNTKRWPKVEVHALIRLRSGMEPRFREAGPKAHLWQEIAASMACLGFIRSPKRCKEKWENINKYFKKTKDSSKKRPENAKTCPYFHQLDTLYQRGILTCASAGGSGGKLGGKSDNLLEYNTQEDEDNYDMQNEENNMQGSDIEGNAGESIKHAENVQGRDKDLSGEHVSMLDAPQNSIFVSSLYSSNAPNVSSTGGGVPMPLVSLPQQMDKYLHHHNEGLNMNAVSKKSLQVEMFVKDILDLQQQQHQKLVDEYDRMEHAHELRELERHQIKAAAAAASAHPHDNATLMALVHKLAGDSSDLSMSAPSSME